MQRRSFLKKTAAVGAAASGVALAGCSGVSSVSYYRATANTEIESTDDSLLVEVSGKVWNERGDGYDRIKLHIQLFEGEKLVDEKNRVIHGSEYSESDDKISYGTSFEVSKNVDVGKLNAETEVVAAWLDGKKYTPTPDGE